METTWFILVAGMLSAYVVLDGFDIGAGIIHLVVARTDQERRSVLRSIGPVWDGNEVWLLAAGGTLFFAFPMVYASSFSGFYLPLNMVLWLLILRAIGIEFRVHLEAQVWRDFFDGLFSLGSVLLAIFFGAALGNVLRGVPLDKDGYFFEPLWTNFKPGPQPGVLDWYTILSGAVAFVALTIHGANYVALKTEGDLNARSKRYARRLAPALIILTVISLVGTMSVRPQLLDSYKDHWIGFIFPLLVAVSFIVMITAYRQNREMSAFLGSCLYLVAMLGGAAFGLYPNLLPASTDPAYSITVYQAAAGRYALSIGLIWWSFGMLIAIGYFIFVYRMFRGKVSTAPEEHGY